MTTSSTWVIACRSSKRWFDLDAVREEYAESTAARNAPHRTPGLYGDKKSRSMKAATLTHAGAPPLDWHSDLPDPAGAIRLADEWEPPARSALEVDGLPRKIVLSMCPWAVCTVCGTPRERVVEHLGMERRTNPPSLAEFSSALSAALKAAGMTHHQAAYRLDVSESLIRHYLGKSGKQNHQLPSITAWGELCDFLTFDDVTMSRMSTVPPDYETADRGNREVDGRLSGGPLPNDLPKRVPAGWSDCGHDSWRPGIVYDPVAGVLLHRTSEDDMTLRYIVGDTRDVTATIPDGSIDLLFTSTPFLALRSYLPADHPLKHLEIGSEANPAAFLDVLLQLTAEWGRVLAPHGTLAVELGDTYSGSSEAGWQRDTGAKRATGWPLAKSLACIPQLYMIGLAYGINPLTGQQSPAGRWRVRNWIAWHRPNPPVGALGDKWRPASSYITVACKGAKRWFDLDAVRQVNPEGQGVGKPPGVRVGPSMTDPDNGGNHRFPIATSHEGGAPPLDWHTDGDLGVGHIILSTQPYPGSHYATFPVDLPRKIIDCMCPRQVCTVCGTPRERVVGVAEYVRKNGSKLDHDGTGFHEHLNDATRGRAQTPTGRDMSMVRTAPTLGWSDCGHDSWRPGIVYDPFAGSGTTLEAAQDLGRDAIGADLDARNADLARQRVGMFLEVSTLPVEESA